MKKKYISNSVKSVRKWKDYTIYTNERFTCTIQTENILYRWYISYTIHALYKWKIYYTDEIFHMYNTNGNYTMQMKNIKYKFKLWN